jgi:hypothetical protein
MNKKIELLLHDIIEVLGRKLFRAVEVEDIGGYIEKEENLSHFGNARVCGDARVTS